MKSVVCIIISFIGNSIVCTWETGNLAENRATGYKSVAAVSCCIQQVRQSFPSFKFTPIYQQELIVMKLVVLTTALLLCAVLQATAGPAAPGLPFGKICIII